MISLSSCRCFPLNSERSRNIPVILPPGRAMLATNPASTGSISRSIPAIGIVRVAFWRLPKPRCRAQFREFRCELGKKFGLVVSRTMFEFDVLSLRVTGLA